jgi:hypothetical protein
VFVFNLSRHCLYDINHNLRYDARHCAAHVIVPTIIDHIRKQQQYKCCCSKQQNEDGILRFAVIMHDIESSSITMISISTSSAFSESLAA